MTTGCLPREHGVVANGFYSRESRQVEMWTSPSDCIQRPQIWDILAGGKKGTALRPHPNPLPEGEGTTGSPHPNPLRAPTEGWSGEGTKVRSAVWFPLHSKGCQADYVCTPAPIHNPDGTESLWCYTRPPELYGTLARPPGPLPSEELLGPAGRHPGEPVDRRFGRAGRGAMAARLLLYLPAAPGLRRAAQRPGERRGRPAVAELDEVIGQLAGRLGAAYGEGLLWLVAGEYAITPVDHVAYPNRVLREAGLLAVRDRGRRRGVGPGGQPGLGARGSPVLPRLRRR